MRLRTFQFQKFPGGDIQNQRMDGAISPDLTNTACGLAPRILRHQCIKTSIGCLWACMRNLNMKLSYCRDSA